MIIEQEKRSEAKRKRDPTISFVQDKPTILKILVHIIAFKMPGHITSSKETTTQEDDAIPSSIDTDSPAKTSYLNVKIPSEEHAGIITLSDYSLTYYPGSTAGKKRRLLWKTLQGVHSNTKSSQRVKLRIDHKKKGQQPLVLELSDRGEMLLIKLDMTRRIAAVNRAKPDSLVALPEEEPVMMAAIPKGTVSGRNSNSTKSDSSSDDSKNLEDCELGGESFHSFSGHAAGLDESWSDHFYSCDKEISLEATEQLSDGEEHLELEGSFFKKIQTATAMKKADPEWMRKFGWTMIAVVVFLFLLIVLIVTFTYKGGVQ